MVWFLPGFLVLKFSNHLGLFLLRKSWLLYTLIVVAQVVKQVEERFVFMDIL